MKKNCNDNWLERGKRYWAEHQNLDNNVKQRFLRQENAIIKLLGSFDWYRILEVGCGYGRILKRVRESFPEAQIAGSDISIEQIRKAKEILGDVEFIIMDIYNGMPFKNKCFDVVFTSEFMMHIPPENVQDIYNELKRVGKRVFMMEYQDPKRYNVVYRPCNWNHNFLKLIDGLNIDKIPNTTNVIVRNW